ncbi:vitamin K-dependent protein C-like [Bradysia coprophila]|uniref:vitamin K-dependent protein C-like n=1 Tax=Bradysia coprophila TaxID=38358 RepID=UPI00187DB423|nr:vitamin K-dependent protein C-like [Bradysia coprophila]
MSFKIGTVFLLLCSLAIAARHNDFRMSRILNGDPATVRPFQFYLQAFNETGNNMDYGAGVLIAPRVVLTVASLIRGFESWVVRFGHNVFGQTSTVTSSNAFLHPNFQTGDLFNLNDIGVVLLNSPIAGNVNPIALPETEVSLPRNYEEGQITNFETNLANPSLGFTATSILRSAFLTAFPQAECAATFPGITGPIFCAFDDDYLSNLCTGDRGTAFVVVFRGVETLAGLTSRTSPGCDDRSTFVQVQPYIPWIRAVANL